MGSVLCIEIVIGIIISGKGTKLRIINYEVQFLKMFYFWFQGLDRIPIPVASGATDRKTTY